MCPLRLPILEHRWRDRQGGNDLNLQRSDLLPASGSHPLSYNTLTVLPTVFLTNCNHILNKFDELYILATDETHHLDIICLTETWLDDLTPDSLCYLPNFSIFRKDRTFGLGGGVMCYVRSDILAHSVQPIVNLGPTVDDSIFATFEILWLILRPKVLPRPCSRLILAIVYCPPWFEASRKRILVKYLT